MAGRGASFTWDSSNLTTNLRNAPARINAAVGRAVAFQAKRSESFMRSNATWTDRTANARNGLTAVSYSAGTTHTIICMHTMPYGIWLEVRWSGKYGILPQTIRQGGAELMALLSKVFAEIT